MQLSKEDSVSYDSLYNVIPGSGKKHNQTAGVLGPHSPTVDPTQVSSSLSIDKNINHNLSQ